MNVANAIRGKHEVRFGGASKYNADALLDVVLRSKLAERLEGWRYNNAGTMPPDDDLEAIARGVAEQFCSNPSEIAASTERLLAPLRA